MAPNITLGMITAHKGEKPDCSDSVTELPVEKMLYEMPHQYSNAKFTPYLQPSFTENRQPQ